MLYVPRTKFLFIHIPRSAGNAITRSLVKALIDKEDMVLNTSIPWTDRHMTLHEALLGLRLKAMDVNAFAIHRDYESIVSSDWRLQVSAGHDVTHEQVREWWAEQLKGERPWEHWAGSGVQRVPYDQISEWWPLICEAAGCEGTPELPKWDFEMDRCDRRCANLSTSE